MIVLASSVVRLTNKGADHGYLYLIDFDKMKYEIVLKWADENIKWEGRGGDRGLRGIILYNNHIIVGSGTQILFLDKNFKIVDIFRHKYLGDIHEMFLDGDNLYITSTLYDLIIVLDLKLKKVNEAYLIKPRKEKIDHRQLFHRKMQAFKRKFLYRYFTENVENNFIFKKINPHNEYLEKTNIKKSIHINTIYKFRGNLCFTGTQYNMVFAIEKERLKKKAIIPYGTHNVTPICTDKFIMNYTMTGKVITTNLKGRIIKKYDVMFDKKKMKGNYLYSHAKPGWNRGLDVDTKRKFFVAGVSPATINLYDFEEKEPIKSITIDSDVRNSIHGIKIIKES